MAHRVAFVETNMPNGASEFQRVGMLIWLQSIVTQNGSFHNFLNDFSRSFRHEDQKWRYIPREFYNTAEHLFHYSYYISTPSVKCLMAKKPWLSI